MLSEESKKNRHRATTISIHITAASWALEIGTSLIVLSLKNLDIDEVETKFILFEVGNLCAFVIIPLTYISNTEIVKEHVKSIGWYISFIDRMRSNKVSPQQNENIAMDVLPNAVP